MRIRHYMNMGCEIFPLDDLNHLRAELQHAGLDSFQIAELLAGFLVQRGYGVCKAEARDTVPPVTGCSIPVLQQHLSRLALFM